MNDSTVDETDARIRRLCERFLGTVRHSIELGMRLETADRNGVTVRLVHNERIVGNPWNGVVHGGPILALLDQTGGLAVACRLFPDYDITPTLDLRIDHLQRPEAGIDFLARAECYRLTSQVAFVRGCAYQTDPDDPVSTFVATYMRLGLNKSLLKKQ
ncbi:MAG: PaaI family thioesterase [Pseudomonadota bacterium]